MLSSTMSRTILLLFLVSMGMGIVHECEGAKSIKVILKNKCKYKVWPEVFPMAKGVTSGMVLSQNQTHMIEMKNPKMDRDSESVWYIWAKTGCKDSVSNGMEATCEMGDCRDNKCPYGVPQDSPVTLVLFDMTVDLFGVSATSGFNVPISVMKAQNKVSDKGGRREGLRCGGDGDVESICPKKLKVITEKTGRCVACKPSNDSTLYRDVIAKACPAGSSDQTKMVPIEDSGVYVVSFCN